MSFDNTIPKKFQEFGPLGVSITVVIVSVLVTFMPFIILSINVLDTTSSSPFILKLFQFFDSGELGLPIYSVCGALASIFIFNHRKFSNYDTIGFIVLILFTVFYTGYVLGNTDGFNKHINAGSITVLIIIYISLALFWCRVIFVSEKMPDDFLTSDDNANKLLDDVKGRRVKK